MVFPSQSLCAILVALATIAPSTDGFAFAVLPSTVQKGSFSGSPRYPNRLSVHGHAQNNNSVDNSSRRWLKIPSMKKILSPKAKRFLAALTLFVTFWRIPTAATNAANARPSPVIKPGTQKRIIQPKEDEGVAPSKSSSIKPLVVVAGASGVAFSIVRRRPSSQEDDQGADEESDVEQSSTSEGMNVGGAKPLEIVETILQEESISPLEETKSLSSSEEQFGQVVALIEDTEEVEESLAEAASSSPEEIEGRIASEAKSSENESLDEDQVEEHPTGILETDGNAKEEPESLVGIENESKYLQEEAIDTALDVIEARRQPKTKTEEDRLATKYGLISDTSERAYQILVDLGMV